MCVCLVYVCMFVYICRAQFQTRLKTFFPCLSSMLNFIAVGYIIVMV